MKICCISDTHNLHEELNKYFTPCSIAKNNIEVLIHAGDFTDKGTYTETKNFLEWFIALPVKYKILIAGNHEIVMDKARYNEKPEFYHPEVWQRKNTDSIIDLVLQGHNKKQYYYLESESVIIEGIKFYGSPFSTHAKYGGGRLPPWGFQHPETILRYAWKSIPDDTDVLITHTPPEGVLDYYHKVNQGSSTLAERVREINPTVHVFGHVHGRNGCIEIDNTVFINAVVVNGNKKVKNGPVIVEVQARSRD
jgi:Icc-related predicted phosphoesterase